MNQQYAYEEEYEDDGLTLKKVGEFFKHAWLRMIIYIVVAALSVTAVALPIKVFYKSEPVAQTTIEFIYSGIERGIAPDGKIFNAEEMISTTVLKSAVDESGLGDKLKDITELRNSMRVEGVPTDEFVRLSAAAADGDTAAAEKLRNYTMYPTRFNIILSDPQNLGLTDDQAKLLLNKVEKSYEKDFQNRYSVKEMFADVYTLSANEALEFTDVYDLYVQAIAAVKTGVEQFSAIGKSFVSTNNKTSFTQLISELSLLSSRYQQFSAYVLSKNIWRNPAAAKSALLESQIDINNRLEPLTKYIVELNKQIASIEPNSTTSDSSNMHIVTIQYPAEYFTYQARLDEANRQVRDYNVQLNNIRTRLEKLDSVDSANKDLIKAAVAQLVELEEKSSELIKLINSTIADYYDTTFTSASISQTKIPIVTRKSAEFNLLIVYAVGLVIALLCASIVSGVKLAKHNAHIKALESEKAEDKRTVDSGEKK